MNRRSYRGGRTSVALALLALLTFAVGSAQARPIGQGATVKLTMSAGSVSKAGLDVLIPSFERANPDIDVSVEYQGTSAVGSQLLLTQLASGNAPDIIGGIWPGCGTPTSVCSLAPKGYLANMPSKPWAKRSTSISISASKYGAGLYVYSPVVTFEGLWTNDSMFKQLGLKVPQTFPQVLEVCRKASARGTVPILLAASQSLVIQQLVGAFALTTVRDYPNWLKRMKAGTATFAGTPGWHAALQKLVDLRNAGCFQPGATGTTSPGAEQQFTAGQALTYANMTSKKGNIESAKPPFGFSQHPFPISDKPNDTTVMLIVGAGWSVYAHSSKTNQAAAQRFLDFLAQPKQSATYASLSGGLSQEQFRKGVLPKYLSSYSRLFKAKKYGVNPVQKWINAESGTALTDYGTAVLTGQASIDEALKKMDAAWKLGPG